MSQDFIDETFKEGVTLRFGVKKRLFLKQSKFQKVEIVESTHHGRMLFNDDCAMLSERDEMIYHEMMAHVPLFLHPNPSRVLIIGGGDGGTAREVLRHDSVKECVMVEIDESVVSGCAEFIPQTAAVFSNPRLNVQIADGVDYVKKSKTEFDVVLVDSTDPVGPAQPLFGLKFYQNIRKLLSPNGIVVAQGETPFYEAKAQSSLLGVLSQCFPIAMPYNFTNMTYPGGLWSFLFASRAIHPLRELNEARLTGKISEFFYYNAQVHKAAFALPNFQRKNLSGLIKEG